MSITTPHISSLPQGKTALILRESATAAGTGIRQFSTDADSVLFSIYVTSITGTIDVTIKTFSEDGKELVVGTFPTISAVTSALVLKKVGDFLSNLKIEVTYTGAVDYEVRARGLFSGESSVKIVGSDAATTSSETVTTTPGVLIPVSLTDRNGLCIRNWNTSGTMYIGFTLAEATITDGYPISAREQFAMDLAAGVVVYAVGDTTIDVRIIEGGQ